jgi:hypothetical protein
MAEVPSIIAELTFLPLRLEADDHCRDHRGALTYRTPSSTGIPCIWVFATSMGRFPKQMWRVSTIWF